MKVDRIAFLGLVTAVAAGACVVTSTESKGDGGSGGTGNSTTTSQGGSGATGGTSQGGATSQGGGGGEVGGSGGAGGAACDDTVGSPAACENIPLDCEPYCLAAHEYLKPMVAEVAVQCLSADTEAYCMSGYGCIGDALGGACPDDTTNDDCDAAVGACSDVTTADECHALMDGLNDAARTEVMACVDAGCDYGLYSCVEGISFLSPG